MKEIGGYLELERFTGEEYYPDAVAVNNGRCALRYIMRARGIKRIRLPAYLCESVAAACRREGVDVEHYHVGPDFLPLLPEAPEDGAWLYVVNYFGQLTDEQIRALQGKYPRLILDHVQAFFHRPPRGIDTVCSCRKFFGVPDGGYALTDARLPEPLPKDRSMNRMTHLLGRLEGPRASEYYDFFKENDRSFTDLEPRAMSELTHNLLRGVRYDQVRAIREENFRILDDAMGARNSLHPRCPAGPYAYPFYCENGMAVKKALAQKGIFVPILWPNVLQTGSELEQNYTANILPLPVDQRYSQTDMEFLLKEVEKHV